jgi:carbonic anhydrase/acetyltransferase-like protein (isoleucine patch superfamily)
MNGRGPLFLRLSRIPVLSYGWLMPLYALGDLAPSLDQGAWAAPSADLIGDVRLGLRASVWFGAVIRADNTPILIGDESNIQDGAIGHSDPDAPLTIGARVTVGHQATSTAARSRTGR